MHLKPVGSIMPQITRTLSWHLTQCPGPATDMPSFGVSVVFPLLPQKAFVCE